MSDSELLRLRQVMDQLRSPGGCSWDAKQTHESLLKYLLEESYELIDAVEQKDTTAIQEELGDLLLQVYFHARIAEENSNQSFDIESVAKVVTDKLINRHPNVFGNDPDVKRNDKSLTDDERVSVWERVKAQEKQRNSALDGVALGQPAILLSTKLLERIKRLKINDVVIPNLNKTFLNIDFSDSKAVGDLLLGLIKLATDSGVDPETALRAANNRLIASVKDIESAT